MEQAREVREQAKDKAQAKVKVKVKVKVQAKDRAQGEEEDEEWEERREAVDHPRVRRDTVFVPNAVSKLLIRSDSPAAERAARSAGQK